MITLSLVILAGFLSAAMNSVRVHYRKSLFSKWFPTKRSFFDESISWKNKFKRGDRNRGPRFLFSTTFLTWTTDFHNLSHFLMILCLISGIVFYTPMAGPILDITILYLSYSISQEWFKKRLVK